MLKQTQTTIEVHYETQPISCNKYGHTGHNYWRCSTQKNNHINVVDLNECIENNLDANASESAKHTADIHANKEAGVFDDDINIHIEVSQTREMYESNECSYKCKYMEIFNEHMQTHTGEKSLSHLP